MGKAVLASQRIGISDRFEWSIPQTPPSRVEVVSGGAPSRTSEELSLLFRRAVNHPDLEIRLEQLVTPGDRVAVAIDPSTPNLIAILDLLVRELEKLQASLSDLVLLAPAEGKDVADAIRTHLQEVPEFQDVQVLVHDPHDRAALAYLAASAEGEPLYFARTLVDADVVIPLCSGAEQGSFSQHRLAAFLYEGFSGGPFAEGESVKGAGAAKGRRESASGTLDPNAAEAFWQLGVLYGIVVSPGVGGGASGIAAGGPAQLDAAVAQSLSAWKCQRVAPADLVIVEVSGEVDQQNWGAAARALRAAGELAAPSGILVLLTDVPAGEICRLAKMRDRKARTALKETPRRGAMEFLLTLEELGKSFGIFLRSRLSEEQTEELGMGYVSAPGELDRLVERQRRSVVIRDAQHVQFGPAAPAVAAMGRLKNDR